MKGNPEDVFAQVHCNVGETGTLMPPAHIGHSRHNMQNEEEVLYMLIHKPTFVMSYMK
jgi:hypothetical protein